MIKTLLNLSLMFISATASGQNTKSVACIVGIWQGSEYIKEPFPDVSNKYLVYFGNKKLEFDTKTEMLKLFVFGFQSESSMPLDLYDKKIKPKELRSQGQYYTEILSSDTNQTNLDFSIDINFTCNSRSLFLFYTEYEKIGKIDTKVRTFLKKKSLEMKRDLLKEFNIPPPDPKITITTPKSFFFQDASEAKPKKSFLLKGDIAFVEETKGDWLFIRFEGKTITRGWMHKRNVQYLK